MSIAFPESKEVEICAYKCWQARGMTHGHHEADWFQAEQLLFLSKNYELIAQHELRCTQKTFLGPTEPRRCRYCAGVKGEVTFAKEAHALPHSIGNRSLISIDECDSCNTFFSAHLEDHLAKFLLVSRALTQVSGKRGVPSFKSKTGVSRVDMLDGVTQIHQSSADPFAQLDHRERRLDIQGESQPFVPLAVLKCLTKMGLAIMPSSDLGDFREAIDWIRIPVHDEGAIRVAGIASCYHWFQPGPIHPDFSWTRLWRRKPAQAYLPYMLFLVVFRNQALQIMMPRCARDNHWVGKQINLPPDPAFYGFDYDHGEPLRTTIPLASTEKQQIHVSAAFHVGSIEQSD